MQYLLKLCDFNSSFFVIKITEKKNWEMLVSTVNWVVFVTMI